MSETTTQLHPIFAECCAKEHTRYAIEAPFIDGEYVAATDGRIVVRMKANGLTLPKPDRPTPSVTSLGWDRSKWHDEPVKIGTLPEPEFPRKCDECGGLGYSDCHACGTEIDCAECDDGFIVVKRAMRLSDGCHICENYLRLLMKHGASLYTPKHDPKCDRPPVYFTVCGDIDGMLMPVKLGADSEVIDVAATDAA